MIPWNAMVTGRRRRDSTWRRGYLWTATATTGSVCQGCVEYLADSTPTLRFNLADDDGAGEALWCELEIDSDQQFSSPVIRYRSQKLTISTGNSVDWEYTVGQEALCEGDNCGYYDIGVRQQRFTGTAWQHITTGAFAPATASISHRPM